MEITKPNCIYVRRKDNKYIFVVLDIYFLGDTFFSYLKII